MLNEKLFSYEEFMAKLGIKGEFVETRNIIASLKEPCPRIEVVYREETEESRAQGEKG